jgi:hypothetical protein
MRSSGTGGSRRRKAKEPCSLPTTPQAPGTLGGLPSDAPMTASQRQSRIRTLQRYGLTLTDFDTLWQGQEGVCFICQKPAKPGKNLHVDHDHKTGLTRGLLCWACNRGLRGFRDDKMRCLRAGFYLTWSPVTRYLDGPRQGPIGSGRKRRVRR